MKVLDLLKSLISIPSLSGSEGKIATFVFEELTKNGFSPKRSGDNVWLEIGDGGSPRILLNSHLDTVPAGHSWTFPPYEPKEKDGCLYGLGSNDAKASMASLMFASMMVGKELKPGQGTILLALTCNEEKGRQGLEVLVSDLLPLDAAIVGEPNGLEICIAQKGVLALELSWKGRSAHAAHGSSDPALQKAIEDLMRLLQIQEWKEDPFLGKTTMQITKFNSGDQTNVIPSQASAILDVRYTPKYSSQELIEFIQQHVRGEVKIYSDRRIAVSTSSDSLIVKAAQKAQPKAPLTGSQTSSDWVFLKGIPTIKMGPGISQVSHTANEYVEIAQVEKAVDVYANTLRSFLLLSSSLQNSSSKL